MKVRQRRGEARAKTESTDSTECPRRVLDKTGMSSLCDIRLLVTLLITIVVLYYEFGDMHGYFKVHGLPSVSADVSTDDTGKQSIYEKISEAETNWEIKDKSALPLFPKLADYHREIVTSSEIAQGYFDQAMVITFAFNHDEAIRSLKYAIKQDPDCAMCHWAIALNYGANINRPPNDKSRLTEGIRYAHLAKEIASKSGFEQDKVSQGLIDAMLVKFPETRTIDADQHSYMVAYMEAMGKLADEFPGDADLLALYSESLMNTMPWKYYDKARVTPDPKTEIVYEMLKKCLAMEPSHLLAMHLYIHIYEASLSQVSSPHVEEIADRLHDTMQPNMAIGHLIHMPSHIYIRIGRFEDAIESNLAAIDNAESYFKHFNITQDGWNAYYRNLYYCHRETFVVYGALMNGRYSAAVAMQEKMFKTCAFSLKNFEFFYEDATWLQKIFIKYGHFDKVLEMKEEDDNVVKDVAGYGIVQFYFAKAFALVSKGDCEDGLKVYENDFLRLAQEEGRREESLFFETAGSLFDVAQHSFLARYADKCEDDWEKSNQEWEETAVLNQHLAYMEPPFWPLNPRACQGQMLLDHSQAAEAEQVFRQDLREFAKNGWGLKGLELALKAQDKDFESVSQEFAQAWKDAEAPIDRACF